MFFALFGLGILFSIVGGLIFLVDAFRVHWLWGLGSIFLAPIVNIVCLIKHWAQTKRGFLLSLLAIPLFGGAFLVMPESTAGNLSATTKSGGQSYFYTSIQRAAMTVAKVKETRNDAPGAPAPTQTLPTAAVIPPLQTQPAKDTASVVVTAPTPKPTLAQRLATNRAAFKTLEGQFAALQTKRKALPKKKNAAAVAAFNVEAKDYSDQLADTRSEQAILLELQRTSQ